MDFWHVLRQACAVLGTMVVMASFAGQAHGQAVFDALALRAEPATVLEARRAFQGDDLTGKDGPMRRVGFKLALLYEEHRAFRATNAEQALAGSTLDDAALDGALSNMTEGVELMNDISASSDYRAHLCRVMARRALRRAAEHASG